MRCRMRPQNISYHLPCIHIRIVNIGTNPPDILSSAFFFTGAYSEHSLIVGMATFSQNLDLIDPATTFTTLTPNGTSSPLIPSLMEFAACLLALYMPWNATVQPRQPASEELLTTSPFASVNIGRKHRS